MKDSHVLRAGFSLVEMSVVIVIIGLLVGAIAATRSFTADSELNSMVSETKYYINAFQQFGQLSNTHHAIPGDFSQASAIWPGAVNGDGSGIIRAGTGNNAELFTAFQHLALSGLIRGGFTGATAGAAGTKVADIGKNIPQSTISHVGYFFDHPDAVDGNVNTANPDNFYYDGKYGHVLRVAAITSGGMPASAFLTPQNALKIDDKYDDGQPAKGWISVPKPAASASAVTPQCASDATTSATYYTAADSELCSLIMNVQ